MAEVSRKRVLSSLLINVLIATALTVAVYCVAIGGGIERSKAAIFAVAIFIFEMAVNIWAAYTYYRNPNYQPSVNVIPTVNWKWLFWLVGAPVLFYVLCEIFYFASALLVVIFVGGLAYAGLSISEVVVEVLVWLLMGIGLVAAAMFLWRSWRRFNAASA